MAFYREILRRDPEQARRMIFLTGGTSPAEMVEFLSSVPNRRIEKPCDMHDLRRMVNELVLQMGPPPAQEALPKQVGRTVSR